MSEYIRATPVNPTDDYYNLGSFGRKITTKSEAAQRWFNRGFIWAYAFNHEEAGNCFQQVVAHDPTCAMGYWGIAFAAGPNYNKAWAAFDPQDLKLSVPKCHHAVKLADNHLAGVTPIENALVKALRYRFPYTEVPDDFTPANKAYADAMREVYREHGKDDLDVITLFADALMNYTPRKFFEVGSGQPIRTSNVVEVQSVLERGLKCPDAKYHPGIQHMYIHLMEMSAWPQKALVAADHLQDLVPDGGHIWHMPSHIYVLVGQYRHSVDANMLASRADDKFYARQGGRNFYSFYRLHDYHSLIYAAMLVGQSKLALESTDRMEATITEDMLRIESPPMANWMEFFKAVRVHVLIRFGLWEEIKDLTIPEDKHLYCVTTTMVHYGKGIACAATGNIEEALRQRDHYHEAAKLVPYSRLDFPNRIWDVLRIATPMLYGEIEYRKGNYDTAFKYLREAVKYDDSLMYTEPWGWMVPTRHAYAALLLEQGHVEDAAQAYREDLGLDQSLTRAHQHPNNVWALHGYHECLLRLGRKSEADIINQQLTVVLAVADVPIASSCFCRLGTANRNSGDKACQDGSCEK